MSFVAIAMGGAAVIGGVASVVSGNKAAGAVKDAATTTDATNRYIYDTTRTDNAPAREIGTGALGKLADLYGVQRSITPAPTPTATGVSGAANYYSYSPEMAIYGYDPNMYGATAATAPASTMTPGYAGFEASPGYAFRRDEAMKAIQRSAAARGGLNSGATMDAINRRVQGEASSESGAYVNGLQSLAGVGQSANAANQAAGQAYGAQQTATNMAAGQASASAYTNTGNAINGGVQNLASAYLYNKGYGSGGGNFAGGGYNPAASAGIHY